MVIAIAHLGPTGTNTEEAALIYQAWLKKQQPHDVAIELRPYQSIAQSLHALSADEVDFAVVPVENSIQGSVAITLDLVWELQPLAIRHRVVLPIHHALISFAENLSQITEVRSHPQALAQCQRWLEKNIPQVTLTEVNSTTETLAHLRANPSLASISSPRAAKLYDLPILEAAINDYPENSTRFWVLGKEPNLEGDLISLAFSFPANIPGVLVKSLDIFAQRNINLSRIESRPTKRYLGEYLFFIDLEGNLRDRAVKNALQELADHTEILKIFGNYDAIPLAIAD